MKGELFYSTNQLVTLSSRIVIGGIGNKKVLISSTASTRKALWIRFLEILLPSYKACRDPLNQWLGCPVSLLDFYTVSIHRFSTPKHENDTHKIKYYEAMICPGSFKNLPLSFHAYPIPNGGGLVAIALRLTYCFTLLYSPL